MKRGADRQLSKDDNPDDEIEEVQTGLQMAKESDLAKREIRGLPKRKNPLIQAGLPPISSAAPAGTPKFGPFSGFGATGGATNPFTFAPSAAAGPPQVPAEVSQSSAPVVAESASNATKKFASFLGPSSTAGAKPAVSSSSDSPKPDASGDTDEVALKYYTSLRGLNTSFLSAVSKAIESDPFVDVVDLVEQYKRHRISVQNEYDGKSSRSTTRSAPSAASKPASSAAPFSFGKPTTSTSATTLVPPSTFAGFPAPSAPASSAAPAPGTGFTPSIAASAAASSPFSFPSAPPAPSDTKPAPMASASPFGAFAAGPSSSSSPAFNPAVSLTPKEADPVLQSKSAFSFGASAPTSTTLSASPFGSSSQPNSGTSLFGNPSKSASTLFGSDRSVAEGKEKEKDKDKLGSTAFASAPFALSIPPGTKLFGDTSSSGSGSIFGAKSTEKDKEKERDKTSPPSSVFGATFGSPAKASPSPFGGFGSAASAATPTQFVFGVAAGGSARGSEGTPSPKAGSVGFSFGSPSRASSQTAAAPSSGLGFSFPPVPPASSGPTAASTPASLEALSSTSRADTPVTEGAQDEGLARTLSPGLHGSEADVEGEGEEDEETTYTVKAKVYKFTTDREGAPTWSDLGVGMLRLKRHKVTNARRAILRSSSSGKIFINFRIYAGLQPKRTAKTVAFTGHITSPDNETQTVQYRLRVGTEAAATEMAEAIEREVRLVQAEASRST